VWASEKFGQIGTGNSISKKYTSFGEDTITLTATDLDGATGSDSISITINPSGSKVTNSLSMSFKYISPGAFLMGSLSYEMGRYDDETSHQVTLTHGFYMQTTELTQGQWEAVMGINPSYFLYGDDYPVERVSWEDAQGFIAAINGRKEGTYRLPTEAEWEYACRAGSTTAFADGDITKQYCENDPNLSAMGWYCYNADDTTHPVAQKRANAWGLYDMHGNLWEFCSDWYDSYPTEPVTNPEGPGTGDYRVFRGGSWYDFAGNCRSAVRSYNTQETQGNYIGLRLVLVSGK
jgi:formylglycine-generating enzyme required for sulfatase activity